jgi:hypothetical protein
MPKDFYSVWDRLASLRVKHEYAIAPGSIITLIVTGIATPIVFLKNISLSSMALELCRRMPRRQTKMSPTPYDLLVQNQDLFEW